MKTKILLSSLLFCMFLFTPSNIEAQDWANLNRFRAENSQVGLPKKSEKRVVFMGNSITQGWKEIHPKFFSDNPYVNRGISGQTTPQMLLRFRQDVVLLEPKVVVILAGTNDIAGNTGPSTLEMIENNLASMCELASSNGIRVVLSSVLPVYDYPWQQGLQPAEKIVTLNAWIKKYTESKGYTYLDYFTPLADERHGMKAEYSEDGVHPNSTGYDVMEPLVQNAIKLAFKQKIRK